MIRKILCLAAVVLMLLMFPLAAEDSDASTAGVDTDEGLPITYETVFDPIGSATIAKTVASVPHKGQCVPLIIPDSVIIEGELYEVKIIGEGSFSNWNIDSITIPDTITKIEKDAFKGCSSVKEIHLNGKLTGEIHGELTEKDIGENAFCLGDEKNHAECDIYGFTPTRDVWDVDNPYEDIFGKYTTVHYKELNPDSRDTYIHIGLISIGVVALLYMGRCVKVKKIKRKKIRKRK